MNSKKDQVNALIFGAGAIGTYIGARLLCAGNNVVFIERAESMEALTSRGMTLESHQGRIHIKGIKAVSSLKLAGRLDKFDVLIIAIKAYDTDHLITELKQFKSDLPVILCLQNGVENEEAYGAQFGMEKVLRASVTSAIRRKDIGYALVEKERGIAIEEKTTFASDLIKIFNTSGLFTVGYANGPGIKWSKMITNLLANATSAILQMLPGDIYSNNDLLKTEIREIQEAVAVMQKLGIKPINLPRAPVRLLISILTKYPLFISQPLMVRLMGKGRGNKEPSLLIDLKLGRNQSEVDFLNGAVARIGAQLDVATPINAFLADTLYQIVSKRIDGDIFRNNPAVLLKRMEESGIHIAGTKKITYN